mmetsp:Transcript_20879/g.18238  ORF Transcript_20879/g.18238 Transcript_20879/m.18238 type:complete len:81 (+) Transcript_20879:150-392(+)|eukprot:CAMPEP_0114576332 /NCGR_PEP_ID=MMETSP0125-20121206/1112_1 /TAXON_ID=485358 ORGANISM="Aristerostoma sp., Strain ATCC 50986" /NCGR_SAMPLE_ID=MMETSP0125 /ASSEMBLY_ACC=CAM_ASM_000245 /LENGTH=80 /DNA_ID=CAMNT_0001764777 /DNA_START=54 /DNA_END=299 /DNA_ORIENTATION=+
MTQSLNKVPPINFANFEKSSTRKEMPSKYMKFDIPKVDIEKVLFMKKKSHVLEKAPERLRNARPSTTSGISKGSQMPVSQ